MTTPASTSPTPVAPEPQDADQTDRVVLRTAQETSGSPGCPCDVIVIDDATGALTAASLDALAEHDDARVHSWTASCARACELADRFSEQLSTGRLVLPDGTDPLPLDEFAAAADAHLALARLPKSLAGLEDRARRIAAAARSTGRDDLELIAGGRVKHMTRSQNEVLAQVFTEVSGSRGLGKSRALIATGPHADAAPSEPSTSMVVVPVRGEPRELPLRGIGGVFGGASADAGSLLLLEALDRALVADEEGLGDGAGRIVVDLGSGNGLLTAHLALALPAARIIASDDDADAVHSTRATIQALAPSDASRIQVTWDDALSQMPDRSADLLVLNPPFHDGTAVDATLVHDLLDASARVLVPDGQLWMVHNSHLRYRAEMERRVGPVTQRARDRRFTVLSARRV